MFCTPPFLFLAMETTLTIKAVNPGDAVYIPELTSAPWISKQSYTVLSANTTLADFPTYGEFSDFVFSIQQYLQPKERPIMFKVIVEAAEKLYSASVDKHGWSLVYVGPGGKNFRHNVMVK